MQTLVRQYPDIAFFAHPSFGGAADPTYAIMGALTLYLDFINLFVLLLQLTGQRRH